MLWQHDPQHLEVVSKGTVSVEGRLEATRLSGRSPKSSRGRPRDPGDTRGRGVTGGTQGRASRPERRRDHAQSLGRPERRADGGGREAPCGRESPHPGRSGDGSVAGRPKGQCGTGVGAAYSGARSHTCPVGSSSSCHAAWLSLPRLLLGLLRSRTRHAIAKQPEAGYLEGTGGSWHR